MLPGTTHAGDTIAQGAQGDVTTAYNNLALETCDSGPSGPTDLAGASLTPGVYCYSTSVQNSGTLTLNGTLSTDVWVFKVGSTLTAGPGSKVVFTVGSAQACNVFWQVGSSATLDTTSTVIGNILALSSITMNNDATLTGRALARNGAVTLDASTANATVCTPPGPPGSGVGLFKVFSPATIPAGGVSILTITFTNTTSLATLQAPFTDSLPSGMTTVGLPTTTCGGTPTVTSTSVGLPSLATIPGGSIATPGFCTLKVNVTVAKDGSYANSVAAGDLYTDVGRNPAGPGVILQVATAIPALSGWAMIMLGTLLALLGFAAIRRLGT